SRRGECHAGAGTRSRLPAKAGPEKRGACMRPPQNRDNAGRVLLPWLSPSARKKGFCFLDQHSIWMFFLHVAIELAGEGWVAFADRLAYAVHVEDRARVFAFLGKDLLDEPLGLLL